MPVEIQEVVVGPGAGVQPGADVVALRQRVSDLEAQVRQLMSVISIAAGRVTISTNGDLVIAAPTIRIGQQGGQVSTECQTTLITTDSLSVISTGDADFAAGVQIRVVGGASARVSAADIILDAPLVDTPGILRCQTMAATTVIASTYTPGVGNLW